MANNNNNNNGNQSGANQGRLLIILMLTTIWNFIDSYPYNAAPSSNVVSTFMNDVFAPAAATRPQAASRAIASLYASVEGHGRHLHAQLRENPDVAAKDIRAERANATLQDRWEPHPWVPVAYAPRPPIAPLIIRKMAWITDKVLSRPGATVDDLAALWAGSPRDPENAGLLLRTLVTSGASNLTKTVAVQAAKLLEAEVEEADEEAEMLRLVQNAEEQLRQQQEEEEEEGEEETEGSRRYNEAFIMHSGNQDNDDNDSFFGYDADGPNNDEPARPQTSPLISHPFPGPNSNEDPFGVSPCAPVAVRPRPESDSESDAPPRQRRRTATTVSSESESEPEAVPDSNASSSPAPAPASRARRVRRARRPRPPAADQQEEIERIAESIYRSTMSQLRQGTFTRRMPLADRRDIAWRARAGVLDAAAVQDEGIVEPNNEPRAGQTFEDYLDSEDDEEMLA
ncbi:uncharacterized protein GLRG_11764 [Colletotrichum graminicola M1.001]|uniref:Uncharacterized protein n=1 Tax=Colletotrichum graminicola (strain M1.001 / M2 / FGSC 10212) TaxID=645133 RepID=E3R0I1_COLGM|nr:uncharacterized protein GLRG_11764 [Colletotrichum graminicola M1.001]EFQ36619.1 hypothetical protein GLRG_11764 [Colletotrichum graminicola M1.001]